MTYQRLRLNRLHNDDQKEDREAHRYRCEADASPDFFKHCS